MKLTNEHKLYIEFAMGCALRVLPIYEKRYPKDDRPRKALEAARTFIFNPTIKNRREACYAAVAAAVDAAVDAAHSAADAAHSAADAAYAAASANAAAFAAAHSAADAAFAAADAADAAAVAADAAAVAADAAHAAADAADAVFERIWQRDFLDYLNFKYSLNLKIKGVSA